MLQVVDLNKYRSPEGLIAPPTSLRPPVGPAVTREQLADVQEGVSAVAEFLETDGYTVSGDYDGYDLRQGLGRSPVALAGRWGLTDFIEGFRYAGREVTTEQSAVRAAGVAYGAYGAAKLILPELYVDDTDMYETCMQLAEEHASHHLDTSVRKAAEIITHRAAATMALLSLKDLTGQAYREAILTAADEGLLTDKVRAADFRHRLGAEYLFMLVGGAKDQIDNSNVIPLH